MTGLIEPPSSSTTPPWLVTPYDLRIGVTGHRHLPADQIPAIDAAVLRVLDRIERTVFEASARPGAASRAVPGGVRGFVERLGERIDRGVTAALRRVWPAVPAAVREVPAELQTPVRWVVVSPLAAGADRIVARGVLARQPSPLDPEQVPPRLEVVLPMPLDKYREDFKDQQDRDEFERLLAQATWTNATDELLPTDVTPGQPRSAAYQLAGHAVANRCDVMLAIWDGQSSSSAGGTGDIVAYSVKQGRPVLWINCAQPDSPVVLLTANASPTSKPWPACSQDERMRCVYIDEFPAHAKQLSLGFHRLAAFHRDAALDPRRYDEALNTRRAELVANLRKFELDDAAREIGETIVPPLVRADMLAERYQFLYRSAVIAIYTLALLAVAVAVAQQVFWPERNAIVVFEVLALLCAWAMLRINRRERWQEKFLNDRYLAEWLRRAQFIVLLPPAARRVAGPSPRTAPAAGRLMLYHGPETWFVDALGRVIEQGAQRIHSADPRRPAARLEMLRQALIDSWIEQQADWHTRKAHQRGHHAKISHEATFWFFALTLLLAAVHCSLGHHLGVTLGKWVTVSVILLPAAAAALHSIERIFDHQRTADRSEQMARQLRRLSDRTAAADDLDELRQTVREVDALMAREVEEWWAAGSLQRPTHPV